MLIEPHETCGCTGTGMAMLAGLQEMHSLGYIHRDVKPANFGVSPAGYTSYGEDDFAGDQLLAYCPHSCI